MIKTKTIIITALILLLFGSGIYIHARMFGNSTDQAFITGNTSTEITASSSTGSTQNIRELVILSASYFFKGQSTIFALSNKVEISDLQSFDSYGANSDLNESLYNIYLAWYYYGKLVEKANITLYNQTVINKLKAFNYDSFVVNFGLNKDVFSEVQGFLQKGDIRGVYARIKGDMATIYNLLLKIQNSNYGNIPSNETMWNLNQQCSKTLLFGQYVTRIFESL